VSSPSQSQIAEATREKAGAAINRIDQIAQHLAGVVPALVRDLHDKITQAITAVIEDSQDAAMEDPPRTVKPVLTIPISVKWNLDGLTVEVTASVSTKTTAEASIDLEDPNQPGLPGLDDSAATPDAVSNFARHLAQVSGADSVTVSAGDDRFVLAGKSTHHTRKGGSR
jgi:hypothetical protein